MRERKFFMTLLPLLPSFYFQSTSLLTLPPNAKFSMFMVTGILNLLAPTACSFLNLGIK